MVGLTVERMPVEKEKGWMISDHPFTERMHDVIEVLKSYDFKACITGSCMLDMDMDEWSDKPDIDMFVYSDQEFIHVIDVLRYRLNMFFGTGSQTSKEQEQWKYERTRDKGIDRKRPLVTAKLHRQSIVVNVTRKKNCDSLIQVLSTFDQTATMLGYDIPNHYTLDLRVQGNVMKSIPNPMRSHDCSMWSTAKWIRQFDRVVKYWERGFDTRPVAEFYLRMIDRSLAEGQLFTSEKSMEIYEEYSKDFVEQRERIAAWLESVESEER